MADTEEWILKALEDVRNIRTPVLVKMFMLSFMELNFRLFKGLAKMMLSFFKWTMAFIDKIVQNRKQKTKQTPKKKK